MAVLDLDDEGGHWDGHAFAFDDDDEVPNVLFRVRTESKEAKQHLVCRDVVALHPHETRILSADELLRDYANVSFPKEIAVDLEWSGQNLTIDWASDVGTKGSAQCISIDADSDPEYVPRADITSWKQFSEYCLELRPRRFIFRGQDCCKRLRTSFHRSRRNSLVHYLLNDLPNVYQTITAQTKHLFNLNDPTQNGAFLNLLQHHGYPTPLLDWTYSPFVAAFFAYRYRRSRLEGDDKVRIFVFDKHEWQNDFNQIQNLAFARPHFSILETLNLENKRALPQQAVSTVTNLDDIERYIQYKEQENSKNYLDIIDLPISERREVMEQLSLMGITAGSLFPGLDGACEELRGRYFYPID